MHVYMYLFICNWIHKNIHIYMHIYIYAYVYTYTYTYMYVHTHVFTYIYIHVCMYVYIYYIYIYIYVCIHVIYIYRYAVTEPFHAALGSSGVGGRQDRGHLPKLHRLEWQRGAAGVLHGIIQYTIIKQNIISIIQSIYYNKT